MKLSEAMALYEECEKASDYSCQFKSCPFHKNITLTIGGESSEGGEIKWKIEGCSLLSKLEKYIKRLKKPEPYPVED